MQAANFKTVRNSGTDVKRDNVERILSKIIPPAWTVVSILFVILYRNPCVLKQSPRGLGMRQPFYSSLTIGTT